MRLALHRHGAVERVDIVALKAEQFSASQAGETAEEHGASELGPDRIGGSRGASSGHFGATRGNSRQKLSHLAKRGLEQAV